MTMTTRTIPPDAPLWILDFVLRQPIPDPLLNDLIRAIIRIDDDSIYSTIPCRVRKSILLRRIRSDLSLGAVSDRILCSLELLREIDAPSITFRSAYAHCALSHLSGTNPDGFLLDAVHSIRNCGVADLERSSAAGLASGNLRTWRREVEGAVEARGGFVGMDTRAEALRSVGEYVREADEEMGPPFLEIKAAEYLRCRGDELARQKGGIEDDRGGGVAESSKQGERRVLDEFERAEASCLDVGGSSSGLDRERARRALEQGLGAGDDTQSNNSLDERNAVTFGSTHPSHRSKHLHTPEVIRAKEALKISCNNLRAVVKDPLPAAVTMAADVLASLSGKATEVKELECCQKNVREDIAGPSCMIADDTHKGQIPNFQPMVNGGGRSRPSLMERNPTAHAYEWEDDSIDSPEDSSGSSKGIRLPSLRKRKVSPLKVAEVSKFTMRRKKHKWSSLEEDTLREGVKKHGKGNWKYILNCYPTVFLERTEVDLKDKWRNMTRYQ